MVLKFIPIMNVRRDAMEAPVIAQLGVAWLTTALIAS